jgi:hypothetical protein
MEFHQCPQDRIDLNRKADFILAYYMVHETPSITNFFSEVASMLKKGGQILVVEPWFHVNKPMFADTLKKAEAAGLAKVDFPKGKGGRSVLLG